MTPRQQKEARACLRWLLWAMDLGPDLGRCGMPDCTVCAARLRARKRIRDRAALLLRQTAPKPARRKKA